MTPAKPRTVFLLVDTPSTSRVVQEGQQPTTMACYSCDIEGSDTVDDTIKRCWLEHQIPPGSVVLTTTDARCDGYTVEPTLVKAKA